MDPYYLLKENCPTHMLTGLITWPAPLRHPFIRSDIVSLCPVLKVCAARQTHQRSSQRTLKHKIALKHTSLLC